MECPRCNEATKIMDSRQRGDRKWRRHHCQCGNRFTTWEIHERNLPEKRFDAAGTLTEREIGCLVASSVAGVLPDLVDTITAEVIKRLTA